MKCSPGTSLASSLAFSSHLLQHKWTRKWVCCERENKQFGPEVYFNQRAAPPSGQKLLLKKGHTSKQAFWSHGKRALQ
jgi:hypothetical protein